MFIVPEQYHTKHIYYHSQLPTYIFSYFSKNPLNDNVSTKQPTLLFGLTIYNSTKRNTCTHWLAKLHTYIESNYKLVPCLAWLKTFEKVFSSSFVCALWVIHNFNTIKCNVAVNTVFQSVIRMASPARTPFQIQSLTHFISLRR